MREGKEEGKREARLNSPKLNQQIKVKGARTAAPIRRNDGAGEGSHTAVGSRSQEKQRGVISDDDDEDDDDDD